MADVLVTGGTGAVGRFVVDELTRQGHRPVVFARSVPAHTHGVAGDVAVRDDLARAVSAHAATHVIHLAAAVGAAFESDIDAAVDANVKGTANVLAVAAEHGVRRVVVMSSKAVYGDVAGRHGPPTYDPIAEDDLPIRPLGVYGLTKAFGEGLCELVRRRHGLDVVAIRSGTTFGPGKGAHHGAGGATSALVERPRNGEPVRIPCGGDARDDFVYYGDLARGLVQACFAEGELLPAYHVSSGIGLSLHDIADEVRRRFPAADIEIGPGPIFNGLDHNLHCVLSIEAAQRDLGYEATSLAEWVDGYLARLDAAAHP